MLQSENSHMRGRIFNLEFILLLLKNEIKLRLTIKKRKWSMVDIHKYISKKEIRNFKPKKKKLHLFRSKSVEIILICTFKVLLFAL